MRTILAALALATPLMSYAAIPNVHTSTLDLTSITEDSVSASQPASTALTVLSDHGGATKVTTAAWGPTHNTSSGGYAEYDYYQMSMAITPAAGYVITGYSVSAYVSGTLETPEKPAEANGSWVPGSAKNSAVVYLPDGHGGTVSKTIDNATTPKLLEFDVHGLSIEQTTKFSFATFTGARASYASWWGLTDGMPDEHMLGSYSHIALTAPSLTIYTALAAVPEPETWAMLLAGIALVGVAKRRGKR
ncbi:MULTISPECIES: PEPxxWA-CTERM sorting domain-containing protein [unclassified Duganella]|uniref:PEPxxWA-CTERM sorting domain-containing protein n=1 Tax=unclassified Duganella TaxID=2636909 RepID=UPI000E352116|nr:MULTISPECIES: PEPxxWA-CTERM sorting domain-containing protein [unclassified Duganella]RFP10165.1 PEP-CTERM sorting domain-containing protein [Duganella sp. BJB475]RFP25529.1 PEP-CTERM sorting domain-containing protein [Duganella sp. BJB476]